MLAQRTQKLIQELKPDCVMVQANTKWWESVRNLQFVDSQDEFSKYGKDLDKYDKEHSVDFYASSRRPLFLARLWSYTALFNFHFGFPTEFNFLRPGLE